MRPFNVRPLFDDDEIYEARDYLSRELSQPGRIQVHAIDPDVDISNIPPLDIIIKDILDNMYGVNCPLMANYLLVQKYVLESVVPALSNYSKHTGFPIQFISTIPATITSQYIIQSARNGNRIQRFWSPHEKWDFRQTIKNKDMSITSPLNGYTHMDMIIPKKAFTETSDKDNFITRLKYTGVIDESSFDEAEENITVKLLPCNTFNKAISIAQAIFKYV